ncbi:hypothetical protein B0H67DRAFT_192203 [Lasiosphaeris hirsuta]|uniref:Uncharacterized protein n=1 Tax=Lasiosphaeris hirsuta TaxID=260670 RepID=A0AA40AR71_9PEZI|nr:hypothetical protein B0H67DRAFT_192203 [Lasiosphaeris hirsuta]
MPPRPKTSTLHCASPSSQIVHRWNVPTHLDCQRQGAASRRAMVTRAVSALNRILKKIRSTVTNVLRISSKEQSPVLDYESLMTLSNLSRAEAIKTIDHLSRRLGSSSSRASVAPSSPKPTKSLPAPPPPPSPASPRQKSRLSHSPDTASTKRRSKTSEMPRSPKKKRSVVKEHREAKEAKAEKEVKSAGSKETLKSTTSKETLRAATSKDTLKPATSKETLNAEVTSPPAWPTPEPRSHLRPQATPERMATAAQNRLSLMSFASDSTKLGEIPERKWRPRYYVSIDTSAEEYNVAPLYPLRPYRPEPREKSFWGGWFGRRREPSHLRNESTLS